MMKFILFCLVTGPISNLFIEMSKKVCASGFHVHSKETKLIFYLPRQALSLSTARSPVLSFISPGLLLKANGNKKIYTNR